MSQNVLCQLMMVLNSSNKIPDREMFLCQLPYTQEFKLVFILRLMARTSDNHYKPTDLKYDID